MASTEGPYSLIPLPSTRSKEPDHAEAFYLDMILIHNVMIRGLNSLSVNATSVKPGDEYAYAGYALSCTELVRVHHDGEEDIIFPFLQTKLNMGNNIEQHHAFQSGLVAYEEYMTNVQKKTEKYDGEKARSLLVNFADALVQHLQDEIPTIEPDLIRTFDKTEMLSMLKAHENYAKSRPGLGTIFPFAICHHDLKDMPQWPPIPGVLRWAARNIFSRLHPSYWKFAPFKFNGEAQRYS